MKSKHLVVWFIAASALFGLIAGIRHAWTDVISKIDITGEIADSSEVLDQLEAAAQSKRVKAVVLYIDSPGGSVATAQDIYRSIDRLRETKPVVAAIGNVGASAAYYVALAANEIWAEPGSLTGSIGVIYEQLNISGLAGRLGVEREVVTAGSFKDTGNMWRKATTEEHRMLRALLNDIYAQFLDVVRLRRGLDETQIRAVSEGRVWTGRQALEHHLIDSIGSWQDAARRAAELAGLPSTAPIHRQRQGVIQDLLREIIKGAMPSYWLREYADGLPRWRMVR